MRWFRLAGLSVLMAISAVSTAWADAAWEAFRVEMGAYDKTVALAEDFAALMRQGDEKGIGKLAEAIGRDLGNRFVPLVREGYLLEPEPESSAMENLESIVAHVAPLGVFADEEATRNALLNLGACETTGILLRNLIFQVADGKPYRVENALIFVDGTSNDREFARSLARCQLLGRHDPALSALGYDRDACLATRRSDCPEIAD